MANSTWLARLPTGRTSTFLDTTASADLSQTVLTQTPQFIQSLRSVEMSLNNVGEIRPPGE